MSDRTSAGICGQLIGLAARRDDPSLARDIIEMFNGRYDFYMMDALRGHEAWLVEHDLLRALWYPEYREWSLIHCGDRRWASAVKPPSLDLENMPPPVMR